MFKLIYIFVDDLIISNNSNNKNLYTGIKIYLNHNVVISHCLLNNLQINLETEYLLLFFFFIVSINVKLPFSGFQCDEHQKDMKSVQPLTAPTKTVCSRASRRRFMCSLCSYSTNFKCALKNHFLVHSGERPHKCEVCYQSFTLLHSLRRHMLIHTGEKPYSCNVCNMSFRQTSNLKMHMRKHFQYLLCIYVVH